MGGIARPFDFVRLEALVQAVQVLYKRTFRLAHPFGIFGDRQILLSNLQKALSVKNCSNSHYGNIKATTESRPYAVFEKIKN